MTYHCGIGKGMEELGLKECEPHLVCDGCGAVRGVYRSKTYYYPAQWFLDGKHAPGWTGERRDDGTRVDYCKACSAARAIGRGEKG